jgi:CRP/FNR family cyclic AMP-dependent transcriptional regulator
MKSIYDLLNEHDFFKDIANQYLQTIAACGKDIHVKSGNYIARDGESADHFYVIRSGLVNVEMQMPPMRTRILQTLQSNDIAGWSWIFPPYKWTVDFKVVEDMSAVALDGKCLRNKCETDSRMGYLLMKQFAIIMTQRLNATRLQALDVYGKKLYD